MPAPAGYLAPGARRTAPGSPSRFIPLAVRRALEISGPTEGQPPMDKSHQLLGFLLALWAVLLPTPASAQHRGGTPHVRAPKPAAQPHMNSGQVHANPAQIRQAQIEQQQFQKAMAQQQAKMAQMERQAHQQHLQQFNQWRNTNATSSGSSSKTGSASSLPESP